MPLSKSTRYVCARATSFSCENDSARRLRSGSGWPVAFDGMIWKVWRSPIQGLGWWLSDSACRRGRLFSSFCSFQRYSQLRVLASVAGVQKLNPCGIAAAGILFPREKVPLAWVPRVVST
jgi:hypothetical protein